MCGIAGFVDFNRKSSLDILKRCTDILAHRGPDGSGYEFFDEGVSQVGMGHRRLSIIDLSASASQPMRYKNYHIIFNGEIYNYTEIRKSLVDLGHVFVTHSDTEVVLHAWEQWGSVMLQSFIGMFVFVIHDENSNTLFACRDRAGVKPFNWYWKDGLFLYGSELKAIVQHPVFEKEINLNAAAAFMQFGYVPAPHSIFNNVQKLKPGHFLSLNTSTRELKIEQYWNVYDQYNKSPLKIDYQEAKTETERILTKAFQYRMVSDVPVGVFLSGGYDSTCVTALLQKNSTQKIKTFTIGIPSTGMDEAPFAKQTAELLGTEHTEYYCTEQEALNIVPQLPFFYDEPFADSSAIPTTLVSKIAREQVTVALSADAGDEIFAGYERYGYIMRYGKKIQAVPPFFRKTLAGIMKNVPASSIPILNKKYLFQSRYEKVKGFLNDPSEQNILVSLSKNSSDDGILNLFKNKVAFVKTAFDSTELQEQYFSTLAFTMAVDYQTYLSDDILQKVDRATMSASLEGREPFLDQHIIEWAAQLPMEYKYKDGEKKIIIKDIVHQYVPKAMMDRPKMGFGIPIAHWLNGELKTLVEYYFSESFLEKQDMFNVHEVQRIKNAFYSSQTESAEKIWYLLTFQMWYGKWMLNE